MLMHLGGVATAGTKAPGGFKHIVLNNGVHDSVGGQPTVALDVQLSRIADACGYRLASGPVTSEDDICSAVRTLLVTEGPAFLEIRITPGSRPDLGRPRETPLENKRLFMAHVRSPGDVANS
jgi:phosphonopyruvate decarboxylase